MLSSNDHIDHQRWLMENGFINDLHKDTLYMYGAICHLKIEAVEVRVVVEKKTVEYDLYMSKALLDKVQLYQELSGSTSIIGLWRFKRLIKKEGNLRFDAILTKFVKDYLGPKWSVVTKLKDIKEYEEGFKQESGASAPADKPADS
jgi:hypothetical protein